MIERAIAAACRSLGLPPIASMALATSKGSYAAPAKAMCSASAANHGFRSWGKPPVVGTAVEIAQDARRSDWRRLSAGAGTKGARLHDWAISNWPISTAKNTTITAGPLDARSSDPPPYRRRRPRLLHHLVSGGTSIKRWSASKAIAGRSRTVSRPRKTSSGSITTRPAPGMAGIAMFRSSCSPSP